MCVCIHKKIKNKNTVDTAADLNEIKVAVQTCQHCNLCVSQVQPLLWINVFIL